VSGGVVRTAHVTQIADDGSSAIVTGLAPAAAVVINGQSGLLDGQNVAAQQIAQR
jgi:hypothetical protein